MQFCIKIEQISVGVFVNDRLNYVTYIVGKGIKYPDQPIRKAVKTLEFVLSEAIYFRMKKSFEEPDRFKGVVRTSDKTFRSQRNLLC